MNKPMARPYLDLTDEDLQHLERQHNKALVQIGVIGACIGSMGTSAMFIVLLLNLAPRCLP